MVTLTPNDIQEGKYQIIEMPVPLWNNEMVAFRQITDNEYRNAMKKRGDVGKVKAKVAMDKQGNIDPNRSLEQRKAETAENMDINVDSVKVQENQDYADRLIVAYGLSHSGNNFKPDDLKNIGPIGIIKQMVDIILRISKVNNPDTLNQETKDFRKPEP